jgi:hypothetical protein
MNHTINRDFGLFGEEYVMHLLHGLGIHCEHSHQADLKTGQVTIEVKASHLTQCDRHHGKRFQFCLWREGHTDFDADFLVCLCCPDGQLVTDTYIIPRAHVDHKHKLIIWPGDYQGKWLPFHDAWNLIIAHSGVVWRGNDD